MATSRGPRHGSQLAGSELARPGLHSREQSMERPAVELFEFGELHMMCVSYELGTMSQNSDHLASGALICSVQ